MIDNVFLDYRSTHETTWMTMDGTILQISKMGHTHIFNCLALLINANETQTPAYKGLITEFEKRWKIKNDQAKIENDINEIRKNIKHLQQRNDMNVSKVRQNLLAMQESLERII